MKINLLSKSIICCSIVFALLGCKKEQLSANGKPVTEERNPGQFKGINVGGASPVYISYGNTFKVEVKGSENLVAKFITKVEGEVLFLKYKDVNVANDDVSVYITMPVITSVKTNGSSSYRITGNFPAQESFSAYISGAGNISFAGTLNVVNLDAEVLGSGNAELEKIVSRNADFKISGSGNIKTTVSDQLKAKIAGSGNVYYNGTPVLNTSYSGSGRVIKN